jgi:hypothetical protein
MTCCFLSLDPGNCWLREERVSKYQSVSLSLLLLPLACVCAWPHSVLLLPYSLDRVAAAVLGGHCYHSPP